METSTTDADNPTTSDAVADSTTTTDPKASTDTQPAPTGDNLDPSKSTDTKPVADGDKKPDADKPKDGDKPPEGDKSVSEDDTSPASQLDDDLDDWIEKRGLPKAETDEQKLAYQKQRNDQREFTRSRQTDQSRKDAKDLNKGIADVKPDPENDDDDIEDPLEKRVKDTEESLANERVYRQQSEFYIDNKITTDEHKAILDIFKEKVESATTPEAKQRAFDLWSTPDALPDLLDLAKVRVGKSVDTTAVADEAARKEREKIARESNATGPGRSATIGGTSDDSPEEERHKNLLERYSKTR